MSEHNENELKATGWNKYISPRVESLRGWFSSSDWTTGISPFLQEQLAILQKQLNAGQPSQRQEDIIRGRLLAIQEFLDLPATIENQIALGNKKKVKPQGDAGY